MIYRGLDSNPFEFAVVAGLRAKQLMAGCVPRVAPAQKCTSTASLEVRAGKVVRVSPVLAPPLGAEQQALSCLSCGGSARPVSVTPVAPESVRVGYQCEQCGHAWTVRVPSLAADAPLPARV